MADAQIQVQVNVAGSEQLKELGTNVQDAGNNAKTAGSNFSEFGKNLTGIIASIGLFSNGLFSVADAFDSVEKADIRVDKANKTVREALQKRDEIQKELNKSSQEGLTIEKTATGQLVTTIDGHKKLVTQMRDGTLAIQNSNGQWQRLVTVVKDAKGNLIATDGTFRSLVTTLKDGSKVYTDSAGNLQVLDDGQKKSKFTVQDLNDANTDLNNAIERQQFAVKQDEKAHAELIPRLISGATQMVGGAAAAAQLGKDLVGMGGKATSSAKDVDTHSKAQAGLLGNITKVAVPLAAIAAAYFILKENIGGSRDALEKLGDQIGKAVPGLQPLLKVIGDIGRGILGLGFGNLTKDIKDLQTQLTPVFNTIKQKFGEMANAFQTFVQQIIRGDLSGAFKTLVDSATKFANDIVNTIKSVNWSQVWQGLQDAWNSTMQWFANAGTNLLNSISTSIKTADWTAIGKTIGDGITKAITFSDEILRTVLSRLTAAWKTAAENYDWKSTTSIITDHMKSSFDSNVAGFTALGTAIFNGIKGALTGKQAATDWGPVGNAVIGGISDGTQKGDWSVVGKNILSAMQATFQTNVEGYTAIGTAIVNAIAGAITGGASQLQAAFTKWVAGIPGWLSGGVQAVTTGISQWITGAGTAIQNAAAGIGAQFQQWVAGIPGALAGGVQAITNAISQWITGAGTAIQNAAAGIGAQFQQWVASIPGALAGGVQAVTNAISQWITGAGTAIQNAAAGIGAQFQQWVAQIPTALAGGVQAVTTAISQWITGAGTAIQNAAAGIGAQFQQWVAQIPTALAGGVQAITNAISQWITSAGTAIQNAAAGIGAQFQQWVAQIPAALAGGVQAITSAISQWITSAGTAIQSGAAGIGAQLQQWVSQIPAALAGGVQAIAGAISQWITSAGTAIQNAAAGIGAQLLQWISQIPTALSGGAQAVATAVGLWVSGAAQSIINAGINIGAYLLQGAQQGLGALGGAVMGGLNTLGGAVQGKRRGGLGFLNETATGKASSLQHLNAAGGGSFVVSKPTRIGNLQVGEGYKPELLTFANLKRGHGSVLSVIPLTGPYSPFKSGRGNLHAQGGGTFPVFGSTPGPGLFPGAGFTADPNYNPNPSIIDYGAGIPAPGASTVGAGQVGPGYLEAGPGVTQMGPPSEVGAGTIIVAKAGGGQSGPAGSPDLSNPAGFFSSMTSSMSGQGGATPQTGLPQAINQAVQQTASNTANLAETSPYQMAQMAAKSIGNEIDPALKNSQMEIANLVSLIKKMFARMSSRDTNTNLLVDGQKIASSVQKYIGSNAYGGM